jgi:hypothetical protein
MTRANLWPWIASLLAGVIGCHADEETLPATDTTERSDEGASDVGDATDLGSDAAADPEATDLADGDTPDPDPDATEDGSGADASSDTAGDSSADCEAEGSGACPPPDALACAGEAFPPADLELCTCPGTSYWIRDEEGCDFRCHCPWGFDGPWNCGRVSSPCDEDFPRQTPAECSYFGPT